jgi:hypothetical protein
MNLNLIESTVVPRPVVYLTLGDGDFTFSADLAVYLSSQLKTGRPGHSTDYDIDDGSSSNRSIQLVATGIDSFEELTSKYKDSPFILQHLLTQQKNSPSLSVSVRHKVNAIILDLDGDSSSNASNPPTSIVSTMPSEGGNDTIDDHSSKMSSTPADHVIFHHPHLGTEDAALHGRFLAHLFYSVTVYWMKPKGGVFHLTLVRGQAERWKCLKAATRHGLILLNQTTFVPPPPTYTTTTTPVLNEARSPSEVVLAGAGAADNPVTPDESHQTHSAASASTTTSQQQHLYQYRRHQSGRSFASRRPDRSSITYTFGRKGDEGLYVARSLPWQQEQHQQQRNLVVQQLAVKIESSTLCVDNTNAQTIQSQLTRVGQTMGPALVCPVCDKEFREERSRSCHIRDRHPEQNNNDLTVEDNTKSRTTRRGRKKARTTAPMTTTTRTSYPCPLCQENKQSSNYCIEVRIFYSEKALAAHIQAKHSAIHSYIAPDWSHSKTSIASSGGCCASNQDDRQDHVEQGHFDVDGADDEINGSEECHICGWQLVGRTMLQHLGDFNPSGEGERPTYVCSFCTKSFHENRAKLQHENFCSRRSALPTSKYQNGQIESIL